MKPLTITLQPEAQIIVGVLLALGAWDAWYYGLDAASLVRWVARRWRAGVRTW